MIKTLLRNTLLPVIFSFLFIPTSKASHVPGANITYTCVGPNQYQVTLTLFEDCGTAFQSNAALTVFASNTCGFTGGGSGSDYSFSLPNTIYQQEVSQLCPNQLNQSECNGGTLPGVWMHQWQGVVTLPGFCDSWTFWYSLCCRNTSTNINNAGSYDIYVETVMNSQTDNCNNSAVITAAPIPYVCVNQPVNYNMGASDADGDSLVYSLIDARGDAVTALPYNGGYTSAQPIPGTVIDPQTGQITFTPTTIGNFVYAVLIQEFDSNGNLIGSVVQDFQFEVINCTNIVPETPVGGISNFTGAGNLTGPTSLELCEGDNVCFDLVFTDDDATQTLTVTSNILTVIPSATISQSGTNPVTVHICYTSQPSDPAFSSVNFYVEDNACPIAAFSNMAIDITILNTCCQMPTTSQVNPSCSQSNGSLTATGQGTGPWDFEWVNSTDTSIVLFSENNVTTSTFNGIPAGTYIVTVTDATGCERTVILTLNNSGSIGVTANGTNETCSGSANGSITASGTGGTSPYDIVITNTGTSTVVSNNQNVTVPVTANGLTTGSYQVSVTDANGCIHDTTIVISAGTIISGNSNVTTETCYLANDASVAVTGSGGSSPYTYVLSGPVTGNNTTGNFGNLSAGNYSVLITDNNGCNTTITFSVTNATPVLADFSATPTTGAAPLSVQFTNQSTGATTYFWSFGDGGTNGTANPSHTYVSDSVFTVMLIAANGPCVDTAYLNIITLQSSIFLPNVFSPNGDAANQTFNFNAINISTLVCKIFDRWGVLVYEFNTPNGFWDGKNNNGKVCTDGVYYYIVEGTGVTAPVIYNPSPTQSSSVDFKYHGTVTLIR